MLKRTSKKALCVLLALLMLVLSVPMAVCAGTTPIMLDSGTYTVDNNSITWSLTDDGTLTVGGSGDIAADTSLPWGFPWYHYIFNQLGFTDPNEFEQFLDFFSVPRLDISDSRMAEEYSRLAQMESTMMNLVKTIHVDNGITSVCSGAFNLLYPERIILSQSVSTLNDYSFCCRFSREVWIYNPQMLISNQSIELYGSDGQTVFPDLDAYKEWVRKRWLDTEINYRLLSFSSSNIQAYISAVYYIASLDYNSNLFADIDTVKTDVLAQVQNLWNSYNIPLPASYDDIWQTAKQEINSFFGTNYQNAQQIIVQDPVNINAYDYSTDFYDAIARYLGFANHNERLNYTPPLDLDRTEEFSTFFGGSTVSYKELGSEDPVTGNMIFHQYSANPINIYPWLTVNGYRGSTAETAAAAPWVRFVPLNPPISAHTLVKTNAVTATCTTAGNSAYWTCSDCGKYFSDANGENEIAANSWVIPAAHGLVNGFDEDSAAATCKNPGFYMKTCLDCLNVVESQTYEKDPNNHANYGTQVRNASEPTCTADGYTGDTVCKGCDAVLQSGAVIPAKGHTWGAWVVTAAPTYLNEGSRMHKCQTCQAEETVAIPKLVPDRSVTDAETGSKLEFQTGVVPEDTQIVVDEEYDGTSFRLLNNEKGNVKKVLFNITLESAGGKIQPNGKVLVKIPIPVGFNPEYLYVYYISGDENRMEKIDCYVESGFVCFETDHFSDYAIVEEISAAENNSNNGNNDQPQKLNFFQRIIQWFRNLFAKLFGR